MYSLYIHPLFRITDETPFCDVYIYRWVKKYNIEGCGINFETYNSTSKQINIIHQQSICCGITTDINWVELLTVYKSIHH